MRTFRHLGAALAASLFLAACGGGGGSPRELGPSGAPTTAGTFSSVISFGDSLSDLGTYTPATSVTGNGAPPYIGGRFTTNQAAGQIWVQTVAASLGLAITPAEVGFNGASQPCPAAAGGPAAAATCTAYGQGGSRITNPAGIGKNPDGSGALTVPVATQIANHLSRKGNFTANDLVFVLAGANDILIQFQVFAGKAAQIQAQVASGAITPQQGNVLLLTAQTEGDIAVETAARQLATLIRTQILANGARYVAVLNVPDIGNTPLGGSLPPTARPVLSGFVATFNTGLREGLDRQPVALLDTTGALAAIIANPAAAGFTNVTVPACDAAVISAITGGLVTDGTSLFCNADALPYNGLRAGASATTWLFADSIHPTTGGHAAIAAFVGGELDELGWVD